MSNHKICCEPCNPIIYQIILSRIRKDGTPEHYYYDFTNNQLGEIAAYIKQMDEEWEAEKKAAWEEWWDRECSTPFVPLKQIM